ncbi:DUF5343 domain-containing protein [Candidatus Pacearchaeota archaeon]|nr:DUF5343 domain-containing protein [Candidatus Pacearchaeota archaeon]
MAKYVYMSNPAKFVQFLETIQTAGVPTKLTIKHLESLGFKGKNDRAIVSIAKALGLITTSGVPTDRWQAYRNKRDAPRVLAEGIRENYAALFKTYPDAQTKDTEALHNFFSTHTTVGAKALGYMIATFRALVGIADFQVAAAKVSSKQAMVASAPVDIAPVQQTKMNIQGQVKNGLAVNINIELSLPENATPQTFDAFFKSMKKHLLD